MAEYKEAPADAPLGVKFMTWIDNRFPATKLWNEHLAEYYAPKNFNFWYFFGSLALLVLVIQIVTGIFLVMNYKPDADFVPGTLTYHLTVQGYNGPGTYTGSGDVAGETWVAIGATPRNGFVFDHWIVSFGQARIEDTRANPTRAWLEGTSVILAVYTQPALEDCAGTPAIDRPFMAARSDFYFVTPGLRPIRAALHARFVTWERAPLDVDAMRRAVPPLIGERDFSAFRTVACQAKSPMRNVREISIARDGEIVAIEIEANAFLHHMVRNIVGSLLPIGRGEQQPEWLGTLLDGRDRAKAGPTAPAEGLAFLGPRYPPEWNLPADVTLASTP